VTIGGGEDAVEGSAGEITKVTQAFQPFGRLPLSNSL
jgi:hypothetical protein